MSAGDDQDHGAPAPDTDDGSGSRLLRGLGLVLPVILTLAVIFWVLRTTELFFAPAVRLVLTEARYVPGMGILVGFLTAVLIGYLASGWLARGLVRGMENLLQRLPLVKSVYASIREMFAYFAPGRKREMGTVVAFTLPGTEAQVLGFVTRSTCTDLPDGLAGEDKVAVYLPMSYQIGGYTLYLPRDAVTPVDTTVEDALRLTLTAGVRGDSEDGDGDAGDRPQAPDAS